MIADSTEIKFTCSRCGQRISVDAAGAGMTASCPTCENPLIIPQLGGLHDRSYGRLAEEHNLRGGRNAPEETLLPGKLPGSADELVEARRRRDEAETALGILRKENIRLQQQLDKATAECGRQTATATAALAEAQSQQGDRQKLKNELAETRQRAAAAEAGFDEARARIAELSTALETVQKNHAQAEDALARNTENARAIEAQLSARETGMQDALARLAASEEAGAAAREETEALTAQLAEMRLQVEQAQAKFLGTATARADLAAAEEKLAAAKLALESMEAERSSFSRQCMVLRGEVETLRHDLSQSHTGNELLALRERFQALETEHHKTAAALAQAEAASKSLAAAGEQLRGELNETRKRAADAESRAEAASESALVRDNSVLRGVIERQKNVLEEHFLELRRLKRARLFLRILYTLFALGLLGVIAYSVDSFSTAARHLLHDWFGL